MCGLNRSDYSLDTVAGCSKHCDSPGPIRAYNNPLALELDIYIVEHHLCKM